VLKFALRLPWGIGKEPWWREKAERPRRFSLDISALAVSRQPSFIFVGGRQSVVVFLNWLVITSSRCGLGIAVALAYDDRETGGIDIALRIHDKEISLSPLERPLFTVILWTHPTRAGNLYSLWVHADHSGLSPIFDPGLRTD